MSLYLLAAFAALVTGAWYYGQGQAVRLRLAAGLTPHSRTPYHGALCAAAAALGGVAIWALAAVVGPGEAYAMQFAALCLGAVGAALIMGRQLGPRLRARDMVEQAVRWGMLALSSFAVVVTLGIVFSLLFEALLFFADVSVFEFLFGTQWSPQTAVDYATSADGASFGSVAVFAGTVLIATIALCVAAPLGLMIAIYLSEYASARRRAVLKPLVEVLAGIPPVVYGVFALLAVGPVIREAGFLLGLSVPVQSALAAGLVMGVMVLPLISSLSDDVIHAVPQALRDGSLALGATRSETVLGAVLPSAMPGVLASILLAVSRAVGETMIVLLVAGRAANLTANPLDTVTTVTVQIVALLTGDQVFDSAKTRAAFALGLVLFIATLALNVIALRVVRRYRVART